MNVASLENCQELHALTGWEDTAYNWSLQRYGGKAGTTVVVKGKTYSRKTTQDKWMVVRRYRSKNQTSPAYNLGYLLRKLPYQNHDHNLELVARQDGTWYLGYSQGIEPLNVGEEPDYLIFVEADTPEDAACKLAIELIKNGVIKV